MAEDTNLLTMASEIVSAYVMNNSVPAGELPRLIKIAYEGLQALSNPPPEPVVESRKASAAQIRKSITDEGLVSFLDGKTYKTLRRHLSTRGMTIADYKAMFGLPSDYPSTSPAYSAARSAMARSFGLGRKPGQKAPRKEKAPAKPVGRPKKTASVAGTRRK